MPAPVQVAIETATDRLAVAVATPDAVMEETLEGARRHAGALLPLLHRLLGDAGATPGDIGLVAVADGPGSFTGLRVGAAVAKAVAHAGDVPMWSAPSLLLRAAGVATPGETVIAVASALRGELFAGAWRFDPGGSVTELVSPRAMGMSQLDALPGADRICGEGPAELLEALSRRGKLPVVGPPAGLPSATTLLRLIGVRGGAARIESPAEWEPVYGRPAEAQVQWELRHGRPLPDSRRDHR